MQIIEEAGLVAICHQLALADGVHALAITVKRAYRLVRSKRAERCADRVPAYAEPVRVASTNPGAGERLVHDTDLASPAKPLTDVILHGALRPRDRRTMLDTGIELGAARKEVRVWGDRSVEVRADGTPTFSKPEAIGELGLVWDHAFGGWDRQAEARKDRGWRARLEDWPPERVDGDDVPGAIAYLRNTTGRGYVAGGAVERIDGLRLPNFDDARDPLTPARMIPRSWRDWVDCPVPAGYGPIDLMTFPRVQLVMPVWTGPAERVREVTTGALRPSDLTERDALGADARAYNAAAPGLAAGPLRGDERLKLWNLHPAAEMFETDLPGERPTLGLELPGVGRRELEASLKAVFVDLDDERVTLTWSGVQRVLMPYPEDLVDRMPMHLGWER